MKKCEGSISIYFVLSIVLIISVVLSVTEIARMNCQKLYLQIATDSALDSMASLYHKDLYEKYSLYGVEYLTKELLETEYLSYIMPYFVDNGSMKEINNWYTGFIDEENIDLKYKHLLDETNLEKEILNYIKYKFIGKVISFFGKDINIENVDDNKKMLQESVSVNKSMEESSLYNEIHKRYFDFEDDIKVLEKHAKNIMNYIKSVNNSIQSASQISTTGSLDNAEKVKDRLDIVNSAINNLKSNLDSFVNKMTDFRKKVNESRNIYLSDKISGKYEFNDDICKFIEEEFLEFTGYVDQNSEMNKKVQLKKSEASSVANNIREYKNNVDSFVYELTSIEEELKDAKSQKGEDRDPDLIKDLNEQRKDIQNELRDYLKELKEEIKDIYISEIDLPISRDNHDKEFQILKSIINCKDDGLMSLVLSSEDISKIDKNKSNIRSFNLMSDNKSLSTNKLLLGEYELDKFNYYNKDKNGELTASGNTALEVERLVSGKESDYENIKGVINKVLLIRIGLNVLYIYKNSHMRQLARGFAYKNFAGMSMLLAETVFLLIITAWGTAQSIVDVKRLLKNYKVRFFHDEESFSVDIDDLFYAISGNGLSVKESDDEGIALSYKDYLRLLLVNSNQCEVNERMVGIIENTIKKTQDNYDINKAIYSFETDNTYTCKHFFTNLVFVNAKSEKLYDEYIFKNHGYRAFTE